MCVTIPGKVIESDSKNAIVIFGDVKKEVKTELVKVSKGDYVLVYAGHVMEKISEERALKILNEFKKV